MNKHFEDAWYYARRAGTNLSRGLREELEPVERRVRAAAGREVEDQSRSRRWRSKLNEAERTVERRVRRALRRVRRGA
ncbi:DUF7553 family protein [Halorussus halobius]|uniref:DUF7553 family protein n=1 Tax=Halorussus halobius TaxID=1710537 RepID=UPI001091ABA4|nr:hypothetical protein [Halorussus halobius]